jgi:hypothetical protein
MIRLLALLLTASPLFATTGPRPDVRIPPPVEVLWVIHVGPLSATEGYAEVRAERDALLALARRVRARATFLVTGDYAEEALARGHEMEWRTLVRDGFEVGTRVPPTAREHLRRWKHHDGVSRFGERGFDATLAKKMWADHRAWVDKLVGAEANRAVDPEPFLCSNEARLAAENGLDVSFGRAGRWLALTDEMAPAPWRAGHSDEPGEEIASAPRAVSALLALDRSAQVGDSFDPRGDCSVLMLFETFMRRAVAPGDLRTFAFLTRASLATRVHAPDVERLVKRLAAYCEGTPNAPRRARWATPTGVRTAHLAYEAAGGPPPQYITKNLEPLALRLRELHLSVIQRLRAEHARQPTNRDNAELRWWAHSLWRQALLSTHRGMLRLVYPDKEYDRLNAALTAGYSEQWASDFDSVLRRMETLARTRPE